MARSPETNPNPSPDQSITLRKVDQDTAERILTAQEQNPQREIVCVWYKNDGSRHETSERPAIFHEETENYAALHYIFRQTMISADEVIIREISEEKSTS